MAMSTRKRADLLLVERGLFESRTQAQAAIAAGQVTANDEPVRKPSDALAVDCVLRAAPAHPWVSRGGVKLAAALDHFGFAVEGRSGLDLGASTGGFTEVLLARGARRVYAVDVGHGQLDWKIRCDPRVIVLEKLNARFLSPAHIRELVDLCVIDVSFISLTLILPNAFELITPSGVILALIKPQFELERADVGRGGIVRNPELHQKAQDKIVQFVTRLGHIVTGIVPSAITGADGNQEFFACMRK